MTGGGEAGYERKKETTFVDVTLLGRPAEIVAQYSKKGRSVMVEGRLQFDFWEDRETHQKCSRLKVIGENVQPLGAPAGAAANGSANQHGTVERSQGQPGAHRQAGVPTVRVELDSADNPLLIQLGDGVKQTLELMRWASPSESTAFHRAKQTCFK